MPSTAPFTAGQLTTLAAFALVALAAHRMGGLLRRARLPLITGYLLTGLLAGPWALGLLADGSPQELRFVDEVALAFIAMAAGAELHLKELRNRLRSIAWVTAGLVAATFATVSAAVFLVGDRLPILAEIPGRGALTVALLTGAVLVARSPSSAIAVVTELKAKGPFTRQALGVTVIMDVVVILLFAVNSSVADALVTAVGFSASTIAQVVAEVMASIALGLAFGLLVRGVLNWRLPDLPAAGLLLLCGYGVFVLSAALRHWTASHWSREVLLEPLLICMVGGFWVTNVSRRRLDLHRLVERVGPPVYVAFFTLAGVSLELDALRRLWLWVLIFFAARLAGLVLGTWVGGSLAGDPPRVNRVGWMAYVTQAGIGLGLAKEIAVEFPGWGETLATLVIAVIVVNQIVGPPLFKRVLRYLGEADVSAEPRRRKTALVLGLDFQAVALAQQLRARGWQVRIATRQDLAQQGEAEDLETVALPDLSVESLRQAGAHQTECLIALMSDDENHSLCRLAYENFGTSQMIVRLNELENRSLFTELGVTVVDPSTAIVKLLEHFAHSPASTGLLLGVDGGDEVRDLECRNPDLAGHVLRDLKLPLDSLVLAVHRHGEKLICHGYTRIELGDRVSIVGSRASLDELAERFEAG